jgi:hypothetical protein
MESTETREPWNKGKPVGQKPPLKSKGHLGSSESTFRTNTLARDLAMFNLAIDGKLRGCESRESARSRHHARQQGLGAGDDRATKDPAASPV